jgi:PAS domain S-box-containing protein
MQGDSQAGESEKQQSQVKVGAPDLPDPLPKDLSEDQLNCPSTGEFLSQNDVLFRSLFEQSAIGVAFLDSEQQLVLVNQKFCDLLGYSAEQLRSLTHETILHPDDLDKILTGIQQLQTGEISSCSLENRYIHSNGSVIWASVAIGLVQNQPVQSQPVQSAMYSILVQEISDRKQVELAAQQQQEQEQALQRVVQTIRNSLDLETVFAVATAEVGQLIGAKRTAIRQYLPEQSCWLLLAEHQPDLTEYISPKRVVPDRNNPFAERLKQFDTVRIDDTDTIDDPTNRALAQLFPGAWLLVPLVIDQKTWGCLTLIKHTPCWHDVEVSLANRIADQLSIAIQQAQLYRQVAHELAERQRVEASLQKSTALLEEIQRLNHSQELFEAVFQASTDAVFLVNAETQLIQTCNQRAVQLFEADSQEQLIGIQGYSLHKDPISSEAQAAIREQFQRQGLWQQEVEYRTYRGNSFWGSLAAKLIVIAGQQLSLVRVTDISDRKQAEHRLQQQAERESLLKQMAFQTRASLNLNHILNTTVSRVHLFLGCDRVVIYRFSADKGGFIAVEAVSQPEFSILGRYLEDPCFSLELAERYRQGHTSAVSDIDSGDIPACYVEFLRNVQVRANLAVPIFQEDQLWGLLIAHHCTTPRPWQPFELEILSQLAIQVGIAIRQTSLYTQLEIELAERRRAEQALAQQLQREQLIRQISQQIRQSLRLENILEAAVTEVRQVLQADRALIFRLNPDRSGTVIKESVLPKYPGTESMYLTDQHFPPESYAFYLQGQVRGVEDTAADYQAECLVEFMQQLQVKSKIIAPLLQVTEEGELAIWGLLIVHACDRSRQWQPADLELMQQLAIQVGIAIQQADLYTQLEKQLRQKEFLLKEVHHRVKNNLQVMSAMLKLQAQTTQNITVLNALEDSRSRLRAIALIHEILYQSNNLERIDFHQYIQRLGNTILAAHGTRTNSISLTYDLQPISINLETAIPCGLLLNELTTNAFKHAFPDKLEGKIHITLAQVADGQVADAKAQRVSVEGAGSKLGKLPKPPRCRYVLTIQDTGVGIPTELDLSALSSLGLRIAYDLALQLQGTLELTRTPGTQFRFTFSELEYRKRF